MRALALGFVLLVASQSAFAASLKIVGEITTVQSGSLLKVGDAVVLVGEARGLKFPPSSPDDGDEAFFGQREFGDLPSEAFSFNTEFYLAEANQPDLLRVRGNTRGSGTVNAVSIEVSGELFESSADYADGFPFTLQLLEENLVGAVGEVIFGESSAVFEVTSVTQVPLPAAAWLFLSALAGMFGLKRLKRSKVEPAMPVLA